MKCCKKCNEIKSYTDFYVVRRNKDGSNCYSPRCKSCLKVDGLSYYHSLTNDKKTERRKKTEEKLGKDYFKNYKLKNNYGISLKEFNEMYEKQKGNCFICEQKISGREVKVDHNHETGKVRKLLCHNCNSALGLLKDNPTLFQRCAEYLNEHINNDNL